MIREQKYKAGVMLNVDIMPWHEKSIGQNSAQECKTNKTPEQMKAENIRKQIKIAIRKANATFTNDDYFCHFTFTPENSPKTFEEAKQIFDNFVRRLKYHRKKSRLSALHAMYGIHNEPYKSGINKGLPRYHYHCLISGSRMSMNEILDIWGYSTINKIDNYQPALYGPESAVRYICDKPAGKKIYYCTQNLKEPKKQKPIDGRLSKGEVASMAQNHINDSAFWEKRYKGYRFFRCDKHYNEKNGHWYLSVYMCKKEYDKKSKRVCSRN